MRWQPDVLSHSKRQTEGHIHLEKAREQFHNTVNEKNLHETSRRDWHCSMMHNVTLAKRPYPCTQNPRQQSKSRVAQQIDKRLTRMNFHLVGTSNFHAPGSLGTINIFMLTATIFRSRTPGRRYCKSFPRIDPPSYTFCSNRKKFEK